MAIKFQGPYAFRPCICCGECLWVHNEDNTCADCGGRSRPTITQAMVEEDCATAQAYVNALQPVTIQSLDQCGQFLAAFNEAKSKYGRYTAFQKYAVERLEYSRVREVYLALGKLLHVKLTEWYDRPA